MGSDIKVDNRIVFYDGFCVVCSRFIKLLIRADKNKLNRFTSISSNYAQNILKDKMSSDQIGKFIVYLSKEGKIYSKSDAVIQVFIELGGLYNIVGILKIFPSSFRNIFYDFFASNRYKWFGKLDQCHLPPKEIADRFYL
jgi:predicted DCC family thiol-disulfide oxidoreductase YuxK